MSLLWFYENYDHPLAESSTIRWSSDQLSGLMATVNQTIGSDEAPYTDENFLDDRSGSDEMYVTDAARFVKFLAHANRIADQQSQFGELVAELERGTHGIAEHAQASALATSLGERIEEDLPADYLAYLSRWAGGEVPYAPRRVELPWLETETHTWQISPVTRVFELVDQLAGALAPGSLPIGEVWPAPGFVLVLQVSRVAEYGSVWLADRNQLRTDPSDTPNDRPALARLAPSFERLLHTWTGPARPSAWRPASDDAASFRQR